MIARLDSTQISPAIGKITPNAVNLLAPSLIKDIQDRGLDMKAPDKLITPREMESIKKQIITAIRKSDKERKLPYHNAYHTENVYKRAKKLLSKSNLKPAEKQLLKLAALYHDFQHGRVGLPASNGRLSFEELSAIAADEHAKKIGLTLKQRLVLYGLIIGTTFSNPAIHPKTKMEKLLVIADLGGFTNTSKEWLQESIHVTMEIPFRHRPDDLQEWLKEQLNFLGYVKKRLTPEAKALNWQASLERKNVLIQKLLKNLDFNKTYSPVIRKIKKTISQA